MEDNGSQKWQDVLAVHPDAQPGLHNSKRIELLRPGVYFDVSALTAESWIPLLRERRQTAEASADAQGQPLAPIEEPVRITIVEIPESIIEVIDGPITVEVGGEQYTINVSVLAHCIKKPTDAPIVVSQGPLQGFYEGSRGDGSGWSH